MERIRTNKLPPPINKAYSYGVKVKPGATLLFLAGQVAENSRGELAGKGDMKAQIRQIVENIKTVLAEAGASLSDVVWMTKYTTDIDTFLKLAEWRRTNYPEIWSVDGPVTTTVEVRKLYHPDCLIEIEVTAAVEA